MLRFTLCLFCRFRHLDCDHFPRSRYHSNSPRLGRCQCPVRHTGALPGPLLCWRLHAELPKVSPQIAMIGFDLIFLDYFGCEIRDSPSAQQQTYWYAVKGTEHAVNFPQQEIFEAIQSSDPTLPRLYCTTCLVRAYIPSWELALTHFCQNKKPLRAKHCTDCNRCVQRFDHQCMWTNKCTLSRFAFPLPSP